MEPSPKRGGIHIPAQFYLLSNRQLSPVNPLNAGWEKCAPSHAYGPHTRHYWLLHYIVSGKGIFESHGVSHTLGAGQCFVIRPGEVTYYRADAEDPWHYIWLGFTVTMPLPEILTQSDTFDARMLSDVFAEIEARSDFFCGKAGDGGAREAYLCGKGVELIALLHAAGSDAAALPRAVSIAKNLIDTEFASDLTVASIAERLHHDRAYFSRCFRAAVGMSPQAYLVERRMTEAARLMTECGFSPSTAATAVGYPDLFSFSKGFKKRFGIPPRAYKEAHGTARKTN